MQIVGFVISRAVVAAVVCAALIAAGHNLRIGDPAPASAGSAATVRVTDVSYGLSDKAGRLAAVNLVVSGAPRGVEIRLSSRGSWFSCRARGDHRWTCLTSRTAIADIVEVSARFR